MDLEVPRPGVFAKTDSIHGIDMNPRHRKPKQKKHPRPRGQQDPRLLRFFVLGLPSIKMLQISKKVKERIHSSKSTATVPVILSSAPLCLHLTQHGIQNTGLLLHPMDSHQTLWHVGELTRTQRSRFLLFLLLPFLFEPLLGRKKRCICSSR